MGYYISRQRYFKENQLAVEIATGGPKKAGVDILTTRYENEGKNLVDPRDAVKYALAIYKKWDRDYADELKKICIIDTNFKEGRQYFEFDKRGISKMELWAEATFKKMDKCGSCGIPMGNKAPYEMENIPGLVFCQEICCAKKYRDMFGVEAPSLTAKAKKK